MPPKGIWPSETAFDEKTETDHPPPPVPPHKDLQPIPIKMECLDNKDEIANDACEDKTDLRFVGIELSKKGVPKPQVRF